MTQLTRWNSNWTFDPFDVVWKNILDSNSTFNTFQYEKINYPVDIYETETGLRFELAVVGLDKSDIEILVESDVLRITHNKKETEGTEKSYLQRGIARRSFDLAWKIASKLNLNKLEANMDKGLLIIDIPYAEEKAPKKVTIK
jgi:HSP20 family molecular chaperone IbpA